MSDTQAKKKLNIKDHPLAKKYNELTQTHVKKIPKAAMMFGIKDILVFVGETVTAVVKLDLRVQELEAQLKSQDSEGAE